ncbi:hypothetical protein K402DRAFT_396759 [Aulographum hederae CBS 113979]|uniref:gamma-glutamylcyclotransferase n=1 Tax=Aulographum hederae CBS 113979 TaxID=1176131 RepID=A0A6G1GQQ3_9PEZI|nr:hypothetical protein K402DRAFT_396759 [Aulographum hederae CBS 113979]
MSSTSDASTAMGAAYSIPHSSTPTLYFGYGSNLWQHQMSLRCPSSTYVGIGRLPGYKWIIHERGYANVVEIFSSSSDNHTLDTSDEVYGLLYTLQPSDEARLDINEGVPHAYTKEYLPIEIWPSDDPRAKIEVSETVPEKGEALVYIDRLRVKESTPKKEYVVRMNHGIDDALAAGVPERYVEGVMRAFIPAGKERKEGGETKRVAEEQAGAFVDGR